MAHEDIPKNIAKNITELRKNAGMTQARLAEEIGYSDKSVSKWERGDGVPDIVCLKNIADLFGVSVDYLLESEHSTSPAAAEQDNSAQSDEQNQSESYIINRAAIVGVTLAGILMLSATKAVRYRVGASVCDSLPGIRTAHRHFQFHLGCDEVQFLHCVAARLVNTFSYLVHSPKLRNVADNAPRHPRGLHSMARVPCEEKGLTVIHLKRRDFSCRFLVVFAVFPG